MERIEVNVQTGEVTSITLTDDEVAALAAAEAERFASLPYGEKRAVEYPDFHDYLDGVVKGDKAQIDAYIAACLAVKAKYPKG